MQRKRTEVPLASHPVSKTLAIPTSLSAVDKLLKEKPAVNADQERKDNAAVPTDEIKTDEAFDEAKLQHVLEEIIDSFKASGKNMEIGLVRQPFEIRGEKVVFFLNGEIQKDIFLSVRSEITMLIRQNLRNTKMYLDCEIKEEAADTSIKLYTSTDKLNYLKEKSPALKELQKRFGLETDF